MKKTIFIAAIFLTGFYNLALAQIRTGNGNRTIEVSDHEKVDRIYDHLHIMDKYNHKFVGTWLYAEGNKKFTLTFEEVSQIMGSVTVDMLKGHMSYFLNGIPAPFSSDQNTISATAGGNPSMLNVSLVNSRSKHLSKIEKYVITFLDHNNIKFMAVQSGGHINELELPIDIVMHRQ